MAQVTVTHSVPAGARIKAFIDGVALSFSSGTAQKTLPAGEHALAWFVVGAPGLTYSLKINAPASAAFTYEAVLDASRKDAGVHWFQL